MKGAIPLYIRQHVQGVLNWFESDDDAKQYADSDALRKLLTPLTEYTPPPVRNPWVLISYAYAGYYGSFKKHYLVPLVDYVVVALSKPTFYFSDEVGKHTEVEAHVDDFVVEFADETHREKYHVTAYSPWNLLGDYAPHYSDEARDALIDAFEKETPAYNVEEDYVPDPQDFVPLIEQTLAPFPMGTVLSWSKCIATGKTTWAGKSEMLNLNLAFPDARMAALFVQSAPKISYCSRNRERYDIDVSTLDKPKVCLEDDAYGTNAVECWTCDPLQWDQMQKECVPRAAWDEMLRVAKSVIRQKRLKGGVLKKE